MLKTWGFETVPRWRGDLRTTRRCWTGAREAKDAGTPCLKRWEAENDAAYRLPIKRRNRLVQLREPLGQPVEHDASGVEECEGVAEGPGLPARIAA
jgi:hypothetical protein